MSADSGVTTLTGAPPAFHLLAKPTGAVCNLDCAYCFFLSKEMLYPGSRFRMADELLETYVRQLIEAHARRARGDDRLAGRRADADGARVLPPLGRARRPVPAAGQRAVYTIQTNGTLLDEEWAAFFKENDFLVGISIDGPREIHDAYRVNKGGQGSFDQVMRGLGHLRGGGRRVERAHDRPRRERASTAREVYRFLRDECGARLHPVHPDHRARRRGGRGRDGAVDVVARPAAVRAGGRARDRPLGRPASSTAAS